MFQDVSFSQPAQTTRRGKTSSVVHFFIRQLKLLESDQDRGHVFFGRSIDLVSTMGVLKNIEKTSTMTHYTIQDNSGTIECLKYISGGSDGLEDSNLKVDSMVTVYGRVKPANGKQLFTVVTIRPIEAYNEVLYHRLSCIRDAALLEQLSKGMSLAVAMGNPGRELAASLVGQHEMDASNANMGGFNFDSVLKNKLMTLIGACTDQFGATKQNLQKALPQVNQKELNDTLQFLADEGHIYTTLTDNHFQMTGR